MPRAVGNINYCWPMELEPAEHLKNYMGTCKVDIELPKELIYKDQSKNLLASKDLIDLHPLP
jgi:hypothetical protein